MSSTQRSLSVLLRLHRMVYGREIQNKIVENTIHWPILFHHEVKASFRTGRLVAEEGGPTSLSPAGSEGGKNASGIDARRQQDEEERRKSTFGDMSPRQKRFAGKVYKAIQAVLTNTASLRQVFVEEAGFSVKDIRMSPDNSKAFILWNTYKSMGSVVQNQEGIEELEAIVQKHAGKLRMALAKKLGVKNVPYIIFKRDSLSEDHIKLQKVLDKISTE